MRRWLAVALLLVSATLAGAQGRPQERGVVGWPPVGAWAVLLLPLPAGQVVCTAITREPPWGPAGYSVAFVLGTATTHFYLSDTATVSPAPRELVLAVDGRIVGRLTVIERAAGGGRGRGALVADLPGDLFVRKVVPPMLRGRTLTVTAGPHRYKVPLGDFGTVMRQISECAQAALAATGWRT